MSGISVTREVARRFLVRKFGLDGWQIFPTVEAVLDQLEFVQEDSISVCGRVHDLILWARVANYTPETLQTVLYTSPRRAFEYYFSNLCVLPLRDYPYFVRTMQRAVAVPGRWGGLLPDEEPVADALLAQLDATGPLLLRNTDNTHGHSTSGWGTKQTMVARVADKLWTHGRLTIARRENFQRVFDRTERLLPEVAGLPWPDETEEVCYKARKQLRAKRLFRRKPALFSALPQSDIVPVMLEGDSKSWYILSEDADDLLSASMQESDRTLHFLAPLDPLIYDRERNRALWDFDYTWEVYTPAAKRKWGYYVLPALYGDKIVGRIEPKLDRKTDTLTVRSLCFEPDANPTVLRPLIDERLQEMAAFLNVSKVKFFINEE